MKTKEHFIPVALAVAILSAIGGGSFAWGQLDSRVEALSARIDAQRHDFKEQVASSKKERDKQETARERVQSTITGISVDLGKLDERLRGYQINTATQLKRVLDKLDEIGGRPN